MKQTKWKDLTDAKSVGRIPLLRRGTRVIVRGKRCHITDVLNTRGSYEASPIKSPHVEYWIGEEDIESFDPTGSYGYQNQC